MSKGVQIAIAAVSMFAALAWIVNSNEGTFVFYPTVAELHQQMRIDPQSVDRRDLRVAGFVLEGSIRKDLGAGKVWFAVRDQSPPPATPETENAGVLPVVYAGIDLPDLFKDGAQVMVEGGFEESQFVARRVMAKCPSKYENAPGVPSGERVASAER